MVVLLAGYNLAVELFQYSEIYICIYRYTDMKTRNRSIKLKERIEWKIQKRVLKLVGKTMNTCTITVDMDITL